MRWPCQVLPCENPAKLVDDIELLSQPEPIIARVAACAACHESLVANARVVRTIGLVDSVPPPPVSGTTKVATPLRRAV